MPRVELRDGWRMPGSVADAQARLHQFFRRHKMQVIGEQVGEVHVRQGSWLTRLVGTRLSRASWLHKRAMVKLQATDQGIAVRASIKVAGQRTDLPPRLATKYQAYFTAWMADLHDQMR